MSEKMSNIINAKLPAELDQYNSLDMMTYSNGARHVYGINEQGKREHISHDDVISAYGYEPRDSGDLGETISPTDTPEDPPTTAEPTPTPTPTPAPELVQAGGWLRPVEDGEFPNGFLNGNSDQSQYLNPEDDDYLPAGIMAHEPWTFADPAETTPADPTEPPIDVPEPPIDVIPPTIEVEPELAEQLAALRSEYAKDTAKTRRSSIGRFAQGNSRLGKLVKKIPGVKQMIEGINGVTDTETAESKEAYREIYNRIAEKAAEQLRAMGLDEASIAAIGLHGENHQHALLEAEISKFRAEGSKDTNDFVNAWVNAKGWKGKAAKVVVVAGVGVLAGATAGLGLGLLGISAGAWAGFAAGGAAGGGIAKHVNRRRANAVEANGKTVAQNQSEEDLSTGRGMRLDSYLNGEFTSVDSTIDTVESRSDKEMADNRKRIRAAVAIGGLAGKLSIGLGQELASSIRGPKGGGETVIDTAPPEAPAGPEAPTPTDLPTPTVDTSSFKYPWNWAEQQFGGSNASTKLYELAEKARLDGHSVQWNNIGSPDAWVRIDGLQDTNSVVNILNKYR